MILIIGGAYQGKKEFARQQLGIQTIFECGAPAHGTPAGAAETNGAPEAPVHNAPAHPDKSLDFSADAISALEEFTWNCCTEDPAERLEAAALMRARRDEWREKVLIITDVSQGIVPMDARTRAFREMNGRLMIYLASEAEEVYRVFCGIGKRIK